MFKNLTDLLGETKSLEQKLDESIALNLNNNYLIENNFTDGSIITSDKAEFQIWQGIKQEKQGDLNLAVSHYRRAIELDSECAQAYQLLSQALKKIRDRRKLESLDDGMNIEQPSLKDLTLNKAQPNSTLIPSTLSPVLEKKSNSQYLDVSNINLSNLTIVNSLDSQQQPELSSIVLLPQTEILPLNDAALQQDLSVAQVYVQQGLVYFEQQQWEQSIAACRAALQICPDLAEAYKIWGNSLQKSGKTAEAMGLYAKALAVQPNMAEIYCNLGTIYAKQKKWEQAIKHYQKSLIIDPKCATPYRNLARVWDKLEEFEKASECFFRALKLSPEILPAKQHFELANNLYKEGKLSQAIDCYSYAVKLQPLFLEAYLKLAETLEQNGQIQEAAFYYKKIAKLRASTGNREAPPKTSQQIRNILNPSAKEVNHEPPRESKPVFQLAAAKTPTTATQIEQYRREAELQPNSSSVIVNLGNLYFDAQQWQKAIACYQKGIKLAPKVAAPYISLGKAFGKIGEKVQASQAFYQGFSLEPAKIAAKNHLRLGNELVAQEQIDWAMACYRRAIQLEPGFVDAYLSMGAILESKNNLPGAIACCQQAIKQNPNEAKSYLLLGRVLTKEKQWQQVIQCYQKAIQLQPDNAQVQHDLGDALAHEGQLEQAAAAYQNAIALKTDNSWSYNNLGDILLKLERWPEAAAAYQRAISLNPEFVWSHQNLGNAFAKQEKWSEAVAAYLNSAKLRSDIPGNYYNLGDALGKLFRWQEAIAAYRQAIKLKPDFAEAYAHLGDVLIREEQWQEGIDCYQQAIKINPGIDISVYRNLAEALERDKYTAQDLNIIKPLTIKQEQKWPYDAPKMEQLPKTLPNGEPWPKISLVTPSYNQGEFIEETILSVINQNYPNIEYILIDGGSTDETMKIVNQYREHFSYVVSQTDKGQSNALNQGFARATGEIFTWLNSDDRLAPGAFYAVATAFYTSKADAVAGVCQILRDGIEIEQHLTSCPNGHISLDEILDVETRWLKGKFFYQPEVMFTRAIWEKAGGYVNESLFYSMDYEMWARFAAEGAKLQVIGHPVAQYRLHEQQKTSSIEKYQPELLKTRDSLRQRFNLSLNNTSQELVARERKSLKIVSLNDTGFLGGAGIAHQRVTQALALAGHQVTSVAGTLDWSLTPVDCTAEEVEQRITSLNPDLVVVGNIHNFRYPLEILEQLTAKFPTIFIMHDQWLLTGRCGYTSGCEKYTILCDAECPTSNSYPRLAPEEIATAFQRKQALLQNNEQLLVFGDSQWLTNWSRYACLNHAPREKYSKLDYKFQPIYYGLDLQVFRPRNSLECRQQLGLPEDKFIILTGSQSLEDERKGFRYLLQALEIANLENCLVLCFGHDFKLETQLEIRSIGYINNSSLLAYYYSAADLFVAPSLEEAFGQTLIEAAACGTPAVGYGVGGVKEAIGNRVSGRVVNSKTPEALAKVIKELYDDREQLQLLSQLAPFYVANNFALTSSYHSMITALESSGWLANLGVAAVSKFSTEPLAENKLFTLKGGSPSSDFDIFAGTGVKGYLLQGFDILESPSPNLGLFNSYRWINKSQAKFVLATDLPQQGKLAISFRNIAPNQKIEVSNSYQILGQGVAQKQTINHSETLTIPVALEPGLNFFYLNLQSYASNQSGRQLYLLIEKIVFTEESACSSSVIPATLVTQRKILMDQSFEGSGWLPPEKINGSTGRWMKKLGCIVVQPISMLLPLELEVYGMAVVDLQLLDTIAIKINGNPIETQVKCNLDGTWTCRGNIPGNLPLAEVPFLITIEVAEVKQLSPNDLSQASLLVESLLIKPQS